MKSTVTLLRCADSDLDVVNAARASFGKMVTEMRPSDEQLIEFLATGLRQKERLALIRRIVAIGNGYIDEWCNPEGTVPLEEDMIRDATAIIDEIQAIQKHWAPFAHPTARFLMRVPLAVARQFWKSHIGAAGGDEQYAWSEESRRYIDGEPEFYEIEEWRARAADKKQGSDGAHEDQLAAKGSSIQSETIAVRTYLDLIQSGYAPEQARMYLPQTMMVTWVWTGSLAFFARVALQRLDDHAQEESREVAKLLSNHMVKLFPVSWHALVLRGRST